MVVNFKLENIAAAALTFLNTVKGRKVIAFHGEMGAGKTTFISAIAHALAVDHSISSPTFSIINEYFSATAGTIYHMDLYRLSSEEEARNAGVEDALYSGNLCLVEWPEKAPGLFPADTVHCYFTLLDHNERKLQINL